jgi:hypothetical protein
MILVLALASFAAGEVPQVMTYQGVLADSDGRPLDGSYNITAKLYTAPAGTTPIWTETHTGVDVAKGVFAIMLGRYTALSDLNFGQRLWLGISVNHGAEMEPRVELASVATAFLAQNVMDKSITARKIANRQIVKSINGRKDDLKIVGEGDIIVEFSAADTITIRYKVCDWNGWSKWSPEYCTGSNPIYCDKFGSKSRHYCDNYRITNTETVRCCLPRPDNGSSQ